MVAIMDYKMKILVYILLVFSILNTSLALAAHRHLPEIPQEKEHSWLLGDQWFDQIYKNYQMGCYDYFLKNLDQAYHQDMSEGRWKSLLNKPYSFPSTSLSNQTSLDKARQEIFSEIEQLVTPYKYLTISKVTKALIENPTPHLSLPDTYYDLDDLPHLMDEPYVNSKCHACYLEVANTYLIKRILLELKTINKEISKCEAQEKQFVIQLEKLQKMKEVARRHKDKEVLESLKQAKEYLRKLASNTHNYQYLNDLAKGKRSPLNHIEFEVGILMHQLLMRQYALVDEIHQVH